jgi:cell division protein FtsZ
MAVVVAALGGGGGTGATPVILSALRSRGVPTLCVVTLPFEFEGRERTATATRALPVLEETADALVSLRLDDLYRDGADAPISEAMVAAEERLGDAISLLWSIVLSPGYISLGPAFLASLLSQSSGRCRFAVASAEGDGRASEAVGLLCRSSMLGASPSLEGVQAVLLGVLAGGDLRLKELSDISGRLRSALPQSCSFNLSTVLDERYAGTVRLIALFFDSIRPDAPPAAEGIEEFKAPAPHKARRRGRGGDGRLAPGERDRFQGTEGTFVDGENLDIPTYQRLRIRLDR